MTSFSISKNFILAEPYTSIAKIKGELVEKGGNQSWFLVVEKNDGSYQIASFIEISDWKKDRKLNNELASILLDELGGPLHPVKSIDEDVIDEKFSPTKDVMLVTWLNTVNGVLSVSSSEEVGSKTYTVAYGLMTSLNFSY